MEKVLRAWGKLTKKKADGLVDCWIIEAMSPKLQM